MTVSDKTNVVVQTYSRGQYPVQVADSPPENPIKGMVRYAVSPWNPLSNGFSGLVVYNGTAWAAV